jgi:AbrB family transcriptional regulator (stage V sporulation protein T)
LKLKENLYMKATGIVRRIDDLGRVVIPKEIRRTMRIREGDPLEIYTSGSGEVIFKKYSPVGEMGQSAHLLCDVISKQCQFCVIATDRDHCVAAAGAGHRDMLDKPISEALESVMEARRQRDFDADSGVSALNSAEAALRFAAPIIAGGDIAGAVALVGNEADVTDADRRLVMAAAAFLSRQMEI